MTYIRVYPAELISWPARQISAYIDVTSLALFPCPALTNRTCILSEGEFTSST